MNFVFSVLGHGHTALYYSTLAMAVEYNALEPNMHMHRLLYSSAGATGSSKPDNTLLVPSYELEAMISAVGKGNQSTVDTLILS